MKTISVISANMRRIIPKDHGRFRWSFRKARAVRLMRKHNPDILMMQECDEQMLPYLVAKLGMSVFKPTAGNRPILFKPELGSVIDSAWMDLGSKCYAHALRQDFGESQIWFVNVHLEARNSVLRRRQLTRLQEWLSNLDGAIVLGGDFSQASVSIAGFKDARTLLPFVEGRQFNSAHFFRTQRKSGRWVDHFLVRDVKPQFLSMIYTYKLDESDHNWLNLGIYV